jgi:hypothetical protein
MGAQHRRDGSDTLVYHLSQLVKELLVRTTSQWSMVGPSPGGFKIDRSARTWEIAAKG